MKKSKPIFLQDFLFYISLIFLFVLNSNAQIIITEILRDPSGGETQLCGGAAFEFFEITNCGYDTLDISNLFFTDGSEADSIISLFDTLPGHNNCLYGQTKLLPGQIALILDPDYQQAILQCNFIYKIKDGTILWMCGDAELGNSLSSTDGILLYKGTKNRIDTIIASAYDGDEIPTTPKSVLKLTVSNPQEGISIIPENSLKSSQCYTNGNANPTPGFYEHFIDGWILEYTFANSILKKEHITCTLMIKQVPQVKSQMHQWAVMYGSVPNLKTLASGHYNPEKEVFEITVSIPMDTFQYFLSVDKVKREIDLSSMWTPDKSLRINEIFPRSNDVEPEWFEVVNISPIVINLKNWYFGFGNDTLKLSTSDFYMNKGSFCIVTSNKTLFLQKYSQVPGCIEPPHWYTLNNYHDSLSLFKPSGYSVDTAVYDASIFSNWSTQSLERVDASKGATLPTAWALSKQTSPCSNNSVSSWRNTTDVRIDAGPIPFTPNNDGKDDLFMIDCSVPPAKQIKISIIAFDGRTVKTFNDPLVSRYFWDGLDNRGKQVENGPFFVIFNISENNKNSIIRKKGVLWR